MSDQQLVDYDDRTLPEYLLDIALTPIRILTSPFASRVYIRTLLFALTAFFLLALSIVAYTLFYYNYIPARGFTLPLHLQFSANHAHHPYAVAQLPRRSIASDQAYDIAVTLCLPRTSENVDAGNFMIDVSILSPQEYKDTVQAETNEGRVTLDEHYVRNLAHEARPALLTMEHPWISSVRRVLWLPMLILGWKTESECLSVPIMESVSFERGWRNLPETARVEIVAQGPAEGVKTLTVERAEMSWDARFTGLRWALFNHRIISFVVLVGAFWACSLLSTVLVWTTVSYISEGLGQGRKEDGVSRSRSTKQTTGSSGEEYELSDVSRTFPTSSRQPPLSFSASRIKREDEDEGVNQGVPVPVAKEEEADDEDEDADFVADAPGMSPSIMRDDSGLGTSLESSGPGATAAVRRRKREDR